MDILNSNETISSTGFGSVKVVQGDGFKYGVDAILLAGFACGETGASAIKKNAIVADLGSGCGIISMVVAYKRLDLLTDEFEVQKEEYVWVFRCAMLSDLQSRCCFHNMNILGTYLKEEFESKYDAVVTNPPYFKRAGAILNDNEAKTVARHETSAGVSDWLRVSNRVLKPGGDYYMVHRPDRLVDIISAMREHNIEPKEMQFVKPRTGKPANIVLIHGVKDARPELKLLKEYVVHGEGQTYTDEINHIYGR